MKKVLFFVFASMTLSIMNAQGFSYGLKAGLNYSNLRFSYETGVNYDPRLSFHAGVVGEYALSDKFSIQSEILYSQLGTTSMVEESTNRAPDNKYIFAIDYISIPLIAKYYVTEGLSLEAGPQLNVLMSAKMSIGTGEMDLKDHYKSTDFGAALGVGYKLENGIFFDARYMLGLSNISEILGDEWAKHSVFQLSAGYNFN